MHRTVFCRAARGGIVTLSFVLLAAGCAKKPEYDRVKSIPGAVEISYEAPKEWGRYLNRAGTAKTSWSVEILHPDNRLVRIDIKKYATSAKTKGFPVLTAARLIADTKALRNAQVGPVEVYAGKQLKFSRFTDTADYIETSGETGKAPHMKDSNAYLEKDGFLYVVCYSSPEEIHGDYLPVFVHLLDTLELQAS